MRVMLVCLFISLNALSAQDDDLNGAQCFKIQDACTAAGYGKNNNDPKKKSVYRDCFSKILNGDSLTDVKVDPEVVRMCKIKKAGLKK